MRALLVGAVFLALVGSPARSQSLSGISVGDNISAVAKLGFSPSDRAQAGPMDMQKWTFPDGNALSITAFRNGRIVYMESNWGGDSNGAFCDIPGLVFGKTTLGDIRKRMGSNGFMYRSRGGIAKIEGGVVALNSYEIAGTALVITFITKFVGSPAKVADLDKLAKLDTVIVGEIAYLNIVWGAQKSFDPSYHSVRLD